MGVKASPSWEFASLWKELRHSRKIAGMLMKGSRAEKNNVSWVVKILAAWKIDEYSKALRCTFFRTRKYLCKVERADLTCDVIKKVAPFVLSKLWILVARWLVNALVTWHVSYKVTTLASTFSLFFSAVPWLFSAAWIFSAAPKTRKDSNVLDTLHLSRALFF